LVLEDHHIEAIKAACLSVEFGSVKICAGTGDTIDIITEKRIRLPKENAAELADKPQGKRRL
jgi:hypothetical protein